MEQEVNEQIDMYLRRARNLAALLKGDVMAECNEHLAQRLAGLNNEPFPFIEQSGGWIGEVLQEAYPEIYAPI